MLQLKEQKETLAALETLDMGKPIEESEWDLVSAHAANPSSHLAAA
jgi:acyl-CoA reductase-like NAD-dependent aldehyde dehydrogenase